MKGFCLYLCKKQRVYFKSFLQTPCNILSMNTDGYGTGSMFGPNGISFHVHQRTKMLYSLSIVSYQPLSLQASFMELRTVGLPKVFL